MKFQITFTEGQTEDHRKWLSFYPKKDHKGFSFTYDKWGYFDPRPMINTSVTSLVAIILPFISLWLLPITVLFLFYGWGSIYLRLPFNSGQYHECDSPGYGIYFYHIGGGIPNEIWIKMGNNRSKVLYLPWYMEWYSTKLLLKDGTWETEKKGDRKEFFKDEWRAVSFVEDNPYTYQLKSGKYQHATATTRIQIREWRPKWFMFTSLFSKKVKSLEIEFSREIGERAGSWKGGCTGCSYEMKPGEDCWDTLKRMERERKFN